MEQSPLFQINLVQCDYNRGWTWHLRIGRKDFTGWMGTPTEDKPPATPEGAYADCMKWLNGVGIEKVQKVIAEEKDVLQSPSV